jgi:hypothetical protein
VPQVSKATTTMAYRDGKHQTGWLGTELGSSSLLFKAMT